MTAHSVDALRDQLTEFVGGPMEPGTTGPEAVNTAMVRHWCEALGDTNPCYLDDDAARAAGHPGIVAPPTMLQAWTMKGLAAAPVAPTAATRVLALLDEAGYTSVVATDCVQTYDRYLVVGDRVGDRITVESVSAQKQTALGIGYFVTTRRDYVDQNGQRVGSMQFRLLKFCPRAKPTARPPRPLPVTTRDTEFFFTGFAEGRLLAQRCGGCNRLRHPPAPSCPYCGSDRFDIEELDRRGTVYSFVVVHHPQPPGFEYPLIIGLVELQDGIRVVANIDGIDSADVRVGLPVELSAPGPDSDQPPTFRPRADS